MLINQLNSSNVVVVNKLLCNGLGRVAMKVLKAPLCEQMVFSDSGCIGSWMA